MIMRTGENIFKRRDGRWEARYIKGYDQSGRIKYGYCYGKTYTEAKEKVSKYKIAVATGLPLPSQVNRRVFSYFCDEWLASKKFMIKQATYVKYTNMFELHIKPKLGSYYPLSINSSLIVSFTDELLEIEKLSPKTVKDILVLLRSVLKFTSKQFPGAIPEIDIVYPKSKPTEMRVLSFDEQQVLCQYLCENITPCNFGILLALFTGLRIGEICALKWKNINLTERTLRVESTMQRLPNLETSTGNKTVVITDTPKSLKSLRTIPMTEYIYCLCEKMNSNNPNAYVITGTEKYLEPRLLQLKFKKVTDACGMKDVHFHTLRHTFATRCVEAGFEIKSLSEILGHSTISITLDRYVHASMELKRKNMNKLDNILLINSQIKLSENE